MSAALVVGRVGGIAVALGVGVAIAHGTAIAAADSASRDSGPSGTSRPASAQGARHAAAGAAAAVKPAASASPARARTGSTAKVPAPAAVPATAHSQSPTAATTFSSAATAAPAAVLDPLAPDPQATVSTPYGDLGKWMINKAGNVADWVGIPYCTGDTCKTLQEPINVIITVEANSKLNAERKLNFKMRMAGFPPSVFSSVGYQGIVGDQTSGQMPRGGILGLGVLGPGNLQNGLLGALAGVGPAYRDAPFWTANSHLRTFGGVPDGNGNYVFTASVSEEYLTKDPVTGKTTHGYESFDQARTKLLAGMEKAGATDQGMVEMFNAIPADDPLYSTGDADGLAQVIAITGMTALAWRAPTSS